MNIPRIILRRVIWILTGLAVYAILGLFSADAHAQCRNVGWPVGDSAAAHPEIEAAYAHCVSQGSGFGITRTPLGGTVYGRFSHCAKHATQNVIVQYWMTLTSASNCTVDGGTQIAGPSHGFSAGCPAGTTWNDALGKCFDPAECLARNAGLGANPPRPSLTLERCVAGCQFKMQANPEISANVATSGGTASMVYRGVMEYSGNACTVTPTSPEGSEEEANTPPPQECVPVAGQTLCIKPNGDHCTAVTGTRQICFKPTETGPKTDGPKLVERNAGETPPPAPSLPPPPNETFQQQGTPFKTTTTNAGGNSGGGGPVIITNTIVYGTTNGTNAGGPGAKDSGESKDGGTGSAGGGADCQSPPIVSGDEPIAMVATQAWATRCAVEAGNAAKVTGDVGDCSSPYTVEGDNANAEQLRALRAQICPQEGTGDGTVDQGAIDGDDDATALGFVTEGAEIGGSGLDTAGLGYSRSCPAMPTINVFGTSVQFDNSVMCDWLQLAGTLVLVLAALASVRILAMGG